MSSKTPTGWDIGTEPKKPARRNTRKYLAMRKYLPTEPLLAYFPPNTTDIEIAERLGSTRRQVHLMRQPNYHIDWLTADRYAIRLGSHPSYIWGDLWAEEVSPLEKQIRPNYG